MISKSELKRLDELDPDFKIQIVSLLDNIESLTETDWTIVQGRRTIAYQNSLYAQGRTKPGQIVTKAKGGQSAHNFGLACFDDKTYILTENGWRLFNELSHGEKVLTWNFNGDLKYESPTDYIEYHYKGDMISIKNRSVDILTTPNHKFPLKRYIKRKFSEWYYDIADNINSSNKIPVAGETLQDEFEPISPYDGCDNETWWEFMGWWISEGSCTGVSDGIVRKHGGRYNVKIYQSKSANPYKCELIENCLRRMNVKWRQYKNSYIISSKKLWSILFPIGNSYQKRVPRYLINSNTRLMNILMNSLILGDGTRYSDGTYGYFSVSKGLCEDVLEISTLLGRPGFIGTREPRKCYSLPSYIGEPKTQFFVRTRTRKELELRSSEDRNGSNIHINKVQYKGMVYCVTVPSGNVVVRRNDKVFISGNCDLCPMKNGQLWWTAPDKKYWEQLGMLTEGIGLTWGGHFKSILDKPHIESPKWKDAQKKWKNGELEIV